MLRNELALLNYDSDRLHFLSRCAEIFPQGATCTDVGNFCSV